MKKILALAFSTVLALLSALAVATPASASTNPDGCRGYVSSFYRESTTNTIYMHYDVKCNVTQSKIGVQGMLTRNGTVYKSSQRTCYNTNWCWAITSVKDISGTQTYYARPVEGFYPPATYAQRSVTVTCSYMYCGGDTKYF